MDWDDILADLLKAIEVAIKAINQTNKHEKEKRTK